MTVNIILCKDCKHKPKNLFVLKANPYATHSLDFPDKLCPLQCVDDNCYNAWVGDDFFCAYGELDKKHFCKDCKYFITEFYDYEDIRMSTINFCYAKKDKEQVHPFENACSSFKERGEK